MQRRRLLQLGLASGAVFAVGGGVAVLLRPGLDDARPTPAGVAVLRAVARAVLDGTLPTEAALRDAALGAHLTRVAATVGGFPPATRAELSQLLGLLASAPGRLALAGLAADWPDASVEQIQHALQGMRTSSLALRQQSYHALRDLTNAAWFSDPSAWSALGYPGPRTL
jgi:hypothetical protein